MKISSSASTASGSISARPGFTAQSSPRRAGDSRLAICAVAAILIKDSTDTRHSL